MDRKKIFKKILTNNIKMDSNNIMKFKDFKNECNFNAFIDPIEKKTKDEIESMIISSQMTQKKFYFEWLEKDTKVKPYYDIDLWFPCK